MTTLPARALALLSLVFFAIPARAGTFIVSTAADEFDTPSGANVSLREALRDAATAGGADTITFAPALSGQTLTLASEIVVNDTTGKVTIDASSLPAGATFSGGGARRILSVDSVSNLALKGVTLTGGNGAGANLSASGGAICNDGTLTLTKCTLSGNSATSGDGGAIYNNNSGMVTLNQCTLSDNSAVNGGAIHNTNTLVLTQCTLAGNSATTGGGIYNDGSALTLTNTIIGGNTATTGPDMFNTGVSALISSGKNLIGKTSGSGLGGPAIVVGAPNLAPLGSYGGPTKTMALLPTSPARNSAQGSNTTSDQRGFPVVGTRDIGAYEAGTFLDFNAYAAETAGVPLSLTGDADKDGRSDLLEYATMTDPRAANFGDIPSRTFTTGTDGIVTGANVGMQVRLNAADLVYTLQGSTSLTGPWTTVATYNGATNLTTVVAPASATINGSGQITVSDPGPNGQLQYFYQVQVQKVH